MNEIKHFETQLLGWAKSTSKKGPQATFLFQSDEDLEFFEKFTLAKGKTAGQIFDMAISLSEQDGQEVPRETKLKGGKLSIDAALLCKEPKFWEYVYDETDLLCKDEWGAKQFICSRCAINSRAELDHNLAAADLFKVIHHNFSEWLNGR